VLNAEVNKNLYTSHFGVLILSAQQTDSGSKLQHVFPWEYQWESQLVLSPNKNVECLSVCQDGGLQCPTCKSIYGVKRGDCPDGTMSYRAISNRLPGYEDCGAIEIVYHFTSGYQVSIRLRSHTIW